MGFSGIVVLFYNILYWVYSFLYVSVLVMPKIGSSFIFFTTWIHQKPQVVRYTAVIRNQDSLDRLFFTFRRELLNIEAILKERVKHVFHFFAVFLLKYILFWSQKQ